MLWIKLMPSHKLNQEQKKQICDRFMNGESASELGEAFGVTRQAIAYILKAHGIKTSQGGRTKQGVVNRQALYDAVNKRCMERYGITTEEKKRLGRLYSHLNRPPTTTYSRNKRDKIRRGYGYVLTFPQWWALWMDSGHWPNYGRSKGSYVMALKSKTYKTFRLNSVEIVKFRAKR